ncbi:MAG: MFS transporter [bacterium]|nr:MFS transporter [bacterium]
MESHKEKLKTLNILHIFNDGFLVSLPLLLPFVTKELHIDIAQVGVLGSLLNMLSIFLALPSAYIAAKIGGMRSLIFAMCLYAVGYILTSFGTSFYFLALAFLVSGIGFGIFHPIAFALVSKHSDPTSKGKTMGNFTAIGDVGRIGISTLITFIIVYIGWRTTALLYGVIALGIFIVFLIFDARKKDEKIAIPDEKKTSAVTIVQLLKNRHFVLTTLIGAFDSFASSSLYIFLPFLLIYRGIDPKIIGSFTAAYFVGNLLGKTLLGRFTDKFGNANVFIVAELLMALFIVFLGNSFSSVMIIVVSMILGTLTKGTVPVVQTMVSDSVAHHGGYEKAFSLNSLVVSIATTLAPLVLGLVSKQYGIVNAFNIAAIFAVCAVVPASVLKLSRESKVKQI